MKFFQKYFKDTDFDSPSLSGEVAVLCPFPHSTPNGDTYYEQHPSAHINPDKSVFHCKVCGVGLSEANFLRLVEGVPYKDAKKLVSNIEESVSEDWTLAVKNLQQSNGAQEKVRQLGISDEVINELQIGYEGSGIGFPVFVYGVLVDVRTYSKDSHHKVMSRRGANAGYIVPFDVWRTDNRPTLLCAGEKDMAIARTKGYNAITFTAGENTLPRFFRNSFNNRQVYIVYDNDDTGKTGARKVAKWLRDCGATPYVVEGHHEICTNKGEDIHDFFQKYGRTKADLDQILSTTLEFSDEDYQVEAEKVTPTVKLIEATQGEYRNKFVTSMVQVSAVFEVQFGIPDMVEFSKVREISEKDSLTIGETREWSLDPDNMEDALLLMDSGLKEAQVLKNLQALAHIPEKEGGLRVTNHSYATVFKAVVTDLVESEVLADDYTPIEIVCYTIGQKLMSGNKYKIIYKTVPHPLQQQEIVLLVSEIEEAVDSISHFKLTDSVKDELRVFQQKDGQTIEERLRQTFISTKSYVGTFADRNIVNAVDLFYNTPLEFYFADRKIRGYLDAMIVGETRTGKSATAEALLRLYRLGTFTSLKTSTVAGLIGGSNKVNGSWKTAIGVIPRNHKGAIILEEFSGASSDFIKSMTDIRSSNQVRLVRVNGELRVPAMVRMLTLSNQRSMRDGQTRPLSSYPNGLEVLLELVGASEDIARYDFFLMVGEPDEYVNPFEARMYGEPYPESNYRNRIRWVWSRKPEQIVFDDNADMYLWDKAQELNKDFNTHIKIFGSEADKKLARIAVACAGCCVSTDETFENIVVTQEHVDWAVTFLRNLYDNDLFRLREYVQEQRKYTEVDDQIIELTQQLYNQHTTLLTHLETTSGTTRNNLQAVSGLDNKDFSAVMNRLTALMLVQWSGDRVTPSVRFRKAMKNIQRNTRLREVGECI